MCEVASAPWEFAGLGVFAESVKGMSEEPAAVPRALRTSRQVPDAGIRKQRLRNKYDCSAAPVDEGEGHASSGTL
jgi:hypothetical protein